MATLHMDVDACNGVKSNMTSIKGELSDKVSALMQSINGMVGTTWIAGGADSFQSDFQAWQSSMSQLLTALEDMSTRLQREIAEWEAAAQGS